MKLIHRNYKNILVQNEFGHKYRPYNIQSNFSIKLLIEITLFNIYEKSIRYIDIYRLNGLLATVKIIARRFR